MTRLGAVVTVVHYENVTRWQDCITFYQSHVIQHSPAGKFMCTQSGGWVGGKHFRKFKDFRKFQSWFKDFQGPFYDFQGPQANLTIFKAISGLEFICQNSRLFKAFKVAWKPWLMMEMKLDRLHLVKEDPSDDWCHLHVDKHSRNSCPSRSGRRLCRPWSLSPGQYTSPSSPTTSKQDVHVNTSEISPALWKLIRL